MAEFFQILAGRLFDGSGSSFLKNMLIHVDSGIIVSLKKADNAISNGTDVIDLSDCTVLPGFVDVHVHLFMSGTHDPEIRHRQLEAPYENMKEIIPRHIRRQLAHGVVAIRDGGDYGAHTARYKQEFLPSKGLPIFLNTAGKAWRAAGRYGRLIGRAPSHGKTLSQAIESHRIGIDHVKIVNSGLNSLREFGKQTLPQFSLDQLRAAVTTAERHGLTVMAHANGELPVMLAIEAGCHSIEHGFFMGQDNLKRMADKQIAWAPTAYTMKAYHHALDDHSVEKEVSKRNFDHQMDQISKAMEFGVPIAIGTDCGSLGVHHGSSFMEELRILMRAGMPLEKALQCATSNGAKVLGKSAELGRLETGMPATLVAFKGDPFRFSSNITAPERIFIRGEPWEADAENANLLRKGASQNGHQIN